MWNDITLCRAYYKNILYCYLMSDNYFCKSKLSEIFYNWYSFVCMDKVPNSLYDIFRDSGEYPKLKEAERLYSKEDINNMFYEFKNHNFRVNPICEGILGK